MFQLMLEPCPLGWTVDPSDPRAPPMDVWERMTERQREKVVELLSSEFEFSEECLPQGDVHDDAVHETRRSLRDHFNKLGRRIYIGADKAVYYPDEARVAPDIIVVLDVEDHPRDSWNVAREGKGPDLCIEMINLSWKAKDAVLNVQRYARLGIQEYFVFDIRRCDLKGYRLGDSPGQYTPLVPKAGRLWSEVLELDLRVEGVNLRFYQGGASILLTDERIARLDAALKDVERYGKEQFEQAQREAERAQIAERKLAEALAQLEALKRN